MAAEVQEWVEGGDVVKKVTSEKEPLVAPPAADSDKGVIVNESLGTGESVSVISDALSEEYSSDSGKGGSDTTITPPDSINEVEAIASNPWLYSTSCPSYLVYSKNLSTVVPNHPMIYEFEISQNYVGRLIGKFGNFVNKLKAESGANIIVKRHFSKERSNNGTIKICAVEGISTEIELAIKLIRDRFPLKRYPGLSLQQVDVSGPPKCDVYFSNTLNLVMGVVNHVCVSSVPDLDHIFVQQPSHPTFPAMHRLHEDLRTFYEHPEGAPKLIRPFNCGLVCVAKIGAKDWVRCEVVVIDEATDIATLKLLDLGGYVNVPIEELRQIRVSFTTIPFQATLCRLANVAPINENEGWSEEAKNFFKIITHGAVLQTEAIGMNPVDNAVLINLYKITGNRHVSVNEEMVTHNYAKWIDEIDHHYYYPLEMYAADVHQLSHNLRGEWASLPRDLITVVSAEEGSLEYVASLTITDDADVTLTEQTQLPEEFADVVAVQDQDFGCSPAELSWFDQMSLEEANDNNNNGDLTVPEEAAKARRKDPPKKKTAT